MELKEDERWPHFGISSAYLEAKAAWLREQRTLHDKSLWFFELAGRLILHSRYDYPLASLAFFQATIGVERALRLHYNTEKESFRNLFSRAVGEQVINNSTFAEVEMLPKRFLEKIDAQPTTHAELLSLLVPRLRNEFVHGTYLMPFEYLHLTSRCGRSPMRWKRGGVEPI